MTTKNPSLLALVCGALVCGALVAAASLPAAAQGGAEGGGDAAQNAFDAQMKKVLEPYLAIQTALAGDSTKGIAQRARVIEKEARMLDARSIAGERAAHYKDLPAELTAAAAELAKAESLEQARRAFKRLSRPMTRWASRAKPKGVHVVFCSMAKASWLQTGANIRNPYYGREMLSCGEIVGGDSAK